MQVEALGAGEHSAVAGGVVSAGVRVTRAGAAQPGVAVRFDVLSGNGSLVDTLVVTGADGSAMALWLLGAATDTQSIRARVGDATLRLAARATAPRPGEVYSGRNAYVEYVPGTLPIIVSAPHGGGMQPAEIADRAYGTLVQDLNTEDLARRIAAALEQRTGARPHLVLTHLHRRKLDTNREIVEAAQGNAAAERAWHEYHAWIDVARHAVEREHGRGFYLDVHGHGHEIQRLELGYLLTASDLALPDATLDDPAYAAKSSIRALAAASPQRFSDVLRGERSLGALLAGQGYPAVPSPADPHPAGAPYFTGGYSTARHGSRDGGRISAVQLEANRAGVRDTEVNREAFAAAVADALTTFLAEHEHLPSGAPPAPRHR